METLIENDAERIGAAMADERARILDALDAWIRQRPGLEYGNYGDPVAYRAELRSITTDLRHARRLLDAVRWRSIDAAALREAFRSAYSGRLSWDGKQLDYCTGQYWPTEYRRAACAVLASALWHYTRESFPHLDGDGLRARLRKEFGRGIASRWFN
jgi:hypothetical protein